MPDPKRELFRFAIVTLFAVVAYTGCSEDQEVLQGPRLLVTADKPYEGALVLVGGEEWGTAELYGASSRMGSGMNYYS